MLNLGFLVVVRTGTPLFIISNSLQDPLGKTCFAGGLIFLASTVHERSTIVPVHPKYKMQMSTWSDLPPNPQHQVAVERGRCGERHRAVTATIQHTSLSLNSSVSACRSLSNTVGVSWVVLLFFFFASVFLQEKTISVTSLVFC